VTASRTREDFFSFRELVAQNYRQARVELVLDNLNTHKDTGRGAFISAWNRRHGKRFVFHYTPTHGSWLNQVERRFAIVTRRVLRHGNFRSVDELVARSTGSSSGGTSRRLTHSAGPTAACR
jgi:transposase